MRRKILIPSLPLSLLCACVERQPLSSHDGGARQSGAGTVAPRQGETHYTRHATATTRAEIIALRINGPFALGDRAGVFRAVNEWNVALKGFVRFEIVLESSPKPAGKTWTVVAAHGNAPQSLAFTYATPSGGLMVVYLERRPGRSRHARARPCPRPWTRQRRADGGALPSDAAAVRRQSSGSSSGGQAQLAAWPAPLVRNLAGSTSPAPAS